MSLTHLVQQLKQIAEEGAVQTSAAGQVQPTSPEQQPSTPAEKAPPSHTNGPSVVTPPKKSQAVPWFAVTAIGLLVMIAFAGYLWWSKRSSEPLEPRVSRRTVAPPLPDAIRRRMPPAEDDGSPPASDDDQARSLAEDTGSGEWSRGGPSESGRHVQFDDHVTEYPIPARATSRRARLEATGPTADEAMPDVPQIRIDRSQLFG
jgi:hypothetical protein